MKKKGRHDDPGGLGKNRILEPSTESAGTPTRTAFGYCDLYGSVQAAGSQPSSSFSSTVTQKLNYMVVDPQGTQAVKEVGLIPYSFFLSPVSKTVVL